MGTKVQRTESTKTVAPKETNQGSSVNERAAKVAGQVFREISVLRGISSLVPARVIEDLDALLEATVLEYVTAERFSSDDVEAFVLHPSSSPEEPSLIENGDKNDPDAILDDAVLEFGIAESNDAILRSALAEHFLLSWVRFCVSLVAKNRVLVNRRK